MFLRTWRSITLILVALLMGTTFCHVLEMPAKMTVSGSLWMTFQHTLYHAFATVGGFVEIGAIVTAIVLSFLVRKRRPALYLTLLTALCLTVAFFVVWLGFTNEVNSETAKWTAETVPGDWAEWRKQWENSHATRFALHLVGFSSLALSVVLETPKEESRDRIAA
jgi:uncharacterized membrane protein